MDTAFFTVSELAMIGRRPPAVPSSRRPGVAWLQKQGRPVYLFGCGEAGRWMAGLLGKDLVRGGVDNNPDKWGTDMEGVRVYSPADADKLIRAENALVIVTVLNSIAAKILMEQSENNGWEWVDYIAVADLLENPVPLHELAENPLVVRCNRLWADEESRRVFRSVVRYRTTLDRADLPEYTEPPYFPGIVPLERYRNFIDVGAYKGDTLRDFRKRFGDDFDGYFAMEPNPERRAELEALAGGDPRIRICMAGASDYSGTAAMSMSGPNLVMHAEGETAFRVERLDDALKDRRAGLIKMDIEGAEPEALRGAETTIREQRPALAVSVYHAVDHLLAIPIWIDDLGLDYRLYLRHHTRGIWDTVCYAVPQ